MDARMIVLAIPPVITFGRHMSADYAARGYRVMEVFRFGTGYGVWGESGFKGHQMANLALITQGQPQFVR
jgi:hypothetical protein